MNRERRPSPVDSLLRLFADVRPGESGSALLLALNVFLILTAYYVIKPVREALIHLASRGLITYFPRKGFKIKLLNEKDVEQPSDDFESLPVALAKFTPDGHFASDRIEVRNLWLPWLAGVTQAISEVMPEDQKLRFKEQIEERNHRLNWRADWPTDTITIDKYYEVPKSERSASP